MTTGRTCNGRNRDDGGRRGMLTRRQAVAFGTIGSIAAMLAGCGSKDDASSSGTTKPDADAVPVADAPSSIDEVIAAMTLDQRVSQLIVPSVARTASDGRDTWDGMDVTDLDAVPRLAEALRRHQYGGIILYGGNIQGVEQTCRLTDALQANNAASDATDASTRVPYLMCADGEGGVVVRLDSGTRMTGAMAIGATGDDAPDAARRTGEVLGGELAAVGVNCDLAPVADVNSNPANPVIGVRSFGDDPDAVARLACSMAEGLEGAGVVACQKHFPGHGDTATDSHTGSAVVDKSLEEMRACELVPFKATVDAGTDLVMTAHITCPQLDGEVTLADGTKGHYPATMSEPILTGILRGELGYGGVVVTDALVMDAIATARLVDGEEWSAEYMANVAERAIGAGADLLLNPCDLAGDGAVAFYDDLIDRICAKVKAGDIPEGRLDESIRRILSLKADRGILSLGTGGATDGGKEGLDARIEEAKKAVGSEEHHVIEMELARKAITVTKDDSTLPLPHDGSYALLVRTADEAALAGYAVSRLAEQGLVAGDARIRNLATGKESGDEGATTRFVIGAYYDIDAGEAIYGGELADAVRDADAAICETTTWGVEALATSSKQREAIEAAIADAKEAGTRFVQFSDNLPYDVACYNARADAQVLAYMSSGTGVDPTEREQDQGMPAYNSNFVAALEAIFGGFATTGRLPVEVPFMATNEDGTARFTDDVMFERGFGIVTQV